MKRIKGTFEKNLWILVKENANLNRFRALLQIRTNPDFFCKDPIEKDSELTVFDFCRSHNQEDIYTFLRRKLSPEQRARVAEWSDT